jgi:alkaline phosphatase D
MVVGATTPDGATFVTKVTTGPVRVAVADNSGMSSPVFTASQAVDAQGVAKVSITGLDPSTAYWWQVEDNSTLDTSVTGRFTTHPALGSHASFTIGVGFCAGATPEYPGVDGGELAQSRVSNHPIFDTIREADPLMFVHIGDFHYYDLGSGSHGIAGGGSLANYRTSYDDVLLQPRQHQLYREVPWAYVWDDHDYGPDNSDGTLTDKANAQDAYRERVPHYPLDDADAIYQSWQIGRVLFVAADSRSDRDPNSDPQGPSKTMLGTAQKAWFENLLETSTAKALVWLMPSVWLHPDGSDTWASFADERQELGAMLLEHGWAHRTVMVCGDRHAAAIDSGMGNDWGGFPVMISGSLDSSPSEGDVAGFYDVLPSTGGRNRYGTVTVTDLGTAIVVELTALDGTDALGSHSLGISIDAATVVAPDALIRTLSGSHRIITEARILVTFQTGDDPDGVEIPTLGGDVRYDATANVFASAGLTTRGHDGLNSLFPRRASDLLAPYGNEIFIRRGVDIGSTVLWTPLGYFRLDVTDQDGDSDQPVTLTGQDRMAGIIDGRLVEPVQFGATRTFASVVNELVDEIYPDAVVLFDDDSGSQQIGRQMVVEEDRHAALRDVAESLGKIIYWDNEGFLRIEDAPEPDVISWEIKAGYKGVLTRSGRTVSREGMKNGFVARGEGASESPVRALAVDIGVNSPTRWGGRFGKVPGFYFSPLLTTETMVRKAAQSMLRRHIGMPYNVSFGSVPNPALRPRDVVRITQKDGNREKHVVETYTVPLAEDVAASGTTREQTLISIGQLVGESITLPEPEEP